MAEAIFRHHVEQLEKFEPNWWEHIDLERLNLESSTDCILGQLFNGFRNAPIELKGLTSFGGNLIPVVSTEDDKDSWAVIALRICWKDLHDAWVNEIEQRNKISEI